ncbi:MAG: response regulator [Candidatus Lokiarchaeota archaeon]
MSSQILLIDDDKDLIFNLRLILQKYDYDVLSAYNGREGLDLLKRLENPPDLIISDIKMPEVNGFEFFNEITNNPLWSDVPFIFLTALKEAKKIREAKEHGISDFLTKPFNEKELLATIKGKIERTKRIKTLDNEINELVTDIKSDDSRNINIKENAILLLIVWDDKVGPQIKKIYPNKKEILPSLDKLAKNLFQTSVLIYGQDGIENPEGILLTLEGLNSKGYLYFDSHVEEKYRAKQKQFMICFIHPKLNYLITIQIRHIFHDMAERFKKNNKINFKEYFDKIKEVFKFETPFQKIL